MNIQFKYDESWVYFSIIDNDKYLETKSWGNLTDLNFFNAISYLIAKINENDDGKNGEIRDKEIAVSHEIISQLNNLDASKLSLPPKVPYILDIRHQSTLSSPNFNMTADWIDLNGSFIVGYNEVGSILEHGSKKFRIFDPFYSIFHKIKLISDITEKKNLYEVWGEIQSYLPKELQESIRTSDALRRTRIAFASSFSLDVKSNEEGFDYEPILFGKKDLDKAKEDNKEISEKINLLPPIIHDKFVENFNNLTNIHSRLSIKDGWYVYLDKGIKESLKVAKSIKAEDKEKRKRFIKNPISIIKEKLQDNLSELELNELENIFVETTQYSERVLDVGIYEKKFFLGLKKREKSGFQIHLVYKLENNIFKLKKIMLVS